MNDRRFGWATTSARVVVGAAIAVCVTAAAVAAVAAPWPGISRGPVAVQATPAPALNLVACSGGLLALGRNAADAGKPVPAASQAVTSGVPAGDGEPEASVLAGSGALDRGGDVLAAAPRDGRLTDVAASGSATVADSDLRGFAASACRQPAMESWLVGGATTTGYADIVLLGNPGAVAATVQLTVYGTAGPKVPPGGAALVVPAGAQIAVPLAGLALGEASPVVRVTARGAPVAASLQTSLTRTLLPVGVDVVGPIETAASETVIPGVVVSDTASAADPTQPASVVRMLSPDTATTATVTVTAVGSGAPVSAPATVPLGAGTPVELDLGTLAAGQYVVRVSSDRPIVAAVRQISGSVAAAAGGTGQTDFAWFTPAPDVSAASLFAVPEGPSPVLTLVNDADAAAAVRVEAPGGSSQTVEVPAHGSVATPLAARTMYTLDPGAGSVKAAVSLSGEGALAGFAVWPSDAGARTITVYP